MSLLLAGVTMAVGWAQGRHGSAGLLVGVIVSAFSDAHASVTALGTLHASAAVGTAEAARAVLAAVTANALTRSVTAWVAGGRAFGARLALSLAASTAAGWAALAATLPR